jgi:hypothetical protein
MLPAPPLPADAQPLVQLVQVGGSGEHQQPGGNQLMTQALFAGEPPVHDDPGAFVGTPGSYEAPRMPPIQDLRRLGLVGPHLPKLRR